MEIVKDSTTSTILPVRKTIRYLMWKRYLHLWDQYVSNRHKLNKSIDPWCQYIINQCYGDVGVYNSGGLFFTDFIKNLTVIEHFRCPINIKGMNYIEDDINFNYNFDCLIMINPESIKYQHNLSDFLAHPGVSRAGFKPNILNWVKPGGKIFLSFTDWYIYYDRLRFSHSNMIDQQLDNLAKIGLTCIYKNVGKLNDAPIVGNIKLILQMNR